MEQHLRLIQGSATRHDQRATDRRRITVPGQMMWKDAKGNTRMVPVVTRDISDRGVAIQCQAAAEIPLYRLVHLQIDRAARNRPDLPPVLRKSTVLSAVFRVGAHDLMTGTPTEYALRLIVEPAAGSASWASDTTETRTA